MYKTTCKGEWWYLCSSDLDYFLSNFVVENFFQITSPLSDNLQYMYPVFN